jgi:hypothetical protein
VSPPIIAAFAGVNSGWALLAGAIWLLLSIPLAIVSLTDWSRTAPPTDSRAGRIGRVVARVPGVALACTAIVIAALSLFRFGVRGWRQPQSWWLVVFVTCVAVLAWGILATVFPAWARRRRRPARPAQ